METIQKNPGAKTLELKSSIDFGRKHKGKTVEQVVKEDPRWILWAQENLGDFIFSPEVLARCVDRNAAPIHFSFILDELKEHLKVLKNIEQGLDPYGDRGVRQLHGFSDKDDIHRTLFYYKRLSEYLVDQLLDQSSIQINKA